MIVMVSVAFGKIESGTFDLSLDTASIHMNQIQIKKGNIRVDMRVELTQKCGDRSNLKTVAE